MSCIKKSNDESDELDEHLQRYEDAQKEIAVNGFFFTISFILFMYCVIMFDQKRTMAFEFVAVVYMYIIFLIVIFYYYGKKNRKGN